MRDERSAPRIGHSGFRLLHFKLKRDVPSRGMLCRTPRCCCHTTYIQRVDFPLRPPQKSRIPGKAATLRPSRLIPVESARRILVKPGARNRRTQGQIATAYNNSLLPPRPPKPPSSALSSSSWSAIFGEFPNGNKTGPVDQTSRKKQRQPTWWSLILIPSNKKGDVSGSQKYARDPPPHLTKFVLHRHHSHPSTHQHPS